MPESEILLTVSQLGIGLAGFSGVVVAFGDRGALSPVDNFRFLSAFSIAMCVVILGLAPVGLSQLSLDSERVWRLSSGIAVAYLVVGTPLFRNYAISLREEFEASGIADESRFTNWAGVTFAIVSLGNVVGWPIAPNFGSYMLALVLALLASAFTFATVVIHRPRGGRGT